MILTKQFLNERVSKRVLDESINSSQRKELDSYDIFLSYSWNDRSFAYKVVELLKACGYTAYVDYSDTQLDRRYVSEKTAKRLVEKMKKCKGLLYLYSPSSSVSKWCPWELGVSDGLKGRVCILPVMNSSFKGQEYLGLYPYLDYERTQDKNRFEFWVNDQNDSQKYTSLRNWLNGNPLTSHN